jgi:hypothetical protein
MVSTSRLTSCASDPAIPASNCFLEMSANHPLSANDLAKAADRSSPLKDPQGYQICEYVRNMVKEEENGE